MKRLLLYILVIFAFTVKSQDISKDISLVNNHYDEIKTMSVDISYKITNIKTNKIEFSQNGYLKRQDAKTVNKIGDKLIITDNDFSFIIDNEVKYIMLSKSNNKDIESKQISPEIVNELIKFCDKVERIEKENSIVLYKLEYKNYGYKEVNIELDLKRKLITKITLYNKPVKDENDDLQEYKIEMIYKNYKIGSGVVKSDFSILKYLNLQNKIYSLRKEYKDYQFVNKLNN